MATLPTVPSNLIPLKLTQLPDAPGASEDGLLMYVFQGNTYKIRAGDLLNVSGVPPSRQVIAGTGLQGGGQLSENVTLSVAPGGINGTLLADSGVTPGVYGSGSQVPVLTVDATGRVMAATSVDVEAAGFVPVTRQVIAGEGLTGGGPLTTDVTLAVNLSNADLPDSGVTAGTSGSATRSATVTVDAKGVLTALTDELITPAFASLTDTPTTVAGYGITDAVSLTGIETLSNKSISGALNTLSAIPNNALDNSSVTINGNSVSLGGSTTVTAVIANALTIGTGLTGSSYDGSAPVTVAINSSVATLTGTQTLSNKRLTAPVIADNFKFEASGIGAYTQFAGTIGSWISNTNNFQVVYAQNQNNGSEASADWVAYNDASDGASYFIDMGINSSNFTSVVYPIFTPNSAYVFTGGGASGQQTDLFIGTSNPASDIIFFTGDVQVANVRGSIQGDTGNWLVGTTTDTGELFQVAGSAKVTGAVTFGSTVLLNADPTLALEAVTKQYVDSAVATGFTVHPAARLATAAALPANTYSNGASGVGATLTAVLNGALSVDGVSVAVGNRVLVKNEVVSANNGCYVVTVAGSAGAAYVLTRATDFDQAAAGEIANNAYFFVSEGATNAGSAFTLSQIAAITVGTTALPFTQFSDQLNYVGGQNIDITGLTVSLTGTVPATNGGTGTSTVTTGDILYGSATDTWSKFPLGPAYKSLVVNAGATQIEWNAVALNQTAAVSGQLGVGNGGTGASTLTGYVKGAGTSALTASTTIPNTDITGLGTMSTQSAGAVAITGGAVDNTPIGATTASTGKFTTLTATGGISGGTF